MIHGAPHYTYALPCGHTVRSYTMAQPADDGWVWLWCNTCDKALCLTIDETLDMEARPRRVNGSRMGEADITRRIDEAIIRERILRLLTQSRGDVTDAAIIEACGKIARSTITAIREHWALLQQRRSVAE